MIVFTTHEHLNRRGVAMDLTRRYGEDYQLVLIDPSSVDELRQKLLPSQANRLIATVQTRDDVVTWLRQNDGPGVPWPKYAFEGV